MSLLHSHKTESQTLEGSWADEVEVKYGSNYKLTIHTCNARQCD